MHFAFCVCNIDLKELHRNLLFQCDTGFSVADIEPSMHMVPGLFQFQVTRSVSRVHAEVVVQPAQGLGMYQVDLAI